MGRGVFWCSLNLSPKVLEDSPIYSSSTLHPATFIAIDDPTFLHHGVLIFRVHQEVLDGSPSLEVYLHTKVTAFFLDTYTQPLIVWNSYVGFRSVVLLSVLVLLFLFLGWIVHPYSHLVQGPSGVVAVAQCSVQMVFFLLQTLVVGAYGLALWYRIPTTPYLDDMG